MIIINELQNFTLLGTTHILRRVVCQLSELFSTQGPWSMGQGLNKQAKDCK